jgi:hypothetical protein
VTQLQLLLGSLFESEHELQIDPTEQVAHFVGQVAQVLLF